MTSELQTPLHGWAHWVGRQWAAFVSYSILRPGNHLLAFVQDFESPDPRSQVHWSEKYSRWGQNNGGACQTEEEQSQDKTRRISYYISFSLQSPFPWGHIILSTPCNGIYWANYNSKVCFKKSFLNVCENICQFSARCGEFSVKCTSLLITRQTWQKETGRRQEVLTSLSSTSKRKSLSLDASSIRWQQRNMALTCFCAIHYLPCKTMRFGEVDDSYS